MDFKDLFNDYRSQILARLSDVLDEKNREFNKRVKFDTDIFEVLESFSTKGKMLRGSLLLFSANAYEKKLDKGLLDLAVSLELMHSALLIHDDIMDNDKLRRGEKTVFAKYENDALKSGYKDPEHVGISMGIIAGDIALFIAQELSVSGDNKTQEILSFYSKELRTVGLGQLLDYSYGIRNKDYTTEQIERMYLDKSARYTFTLPLCLGATAARASDVQIDLIEKLSEKLGLIFQLVDDDIGIFGNEEEIGKPVGSDIKENKKTFLRKLLFDKSSDDEKMRFLKIFGSEEISDSDINYVRNKIVELGVREELEKVIYDYSKECLEIINSLDISEEYKKIFGQIVDININRRN